MTDWSRRFPERTVSAMDTNLSNGRAHTHEGDSAFPTAPQWQDMFPGLNLFTDQFGHAWARVPSGDHYENLRAKGRLFRNWLIRGMLASPNGLHADESPSDWTPSRQSRTRIDTPCTTAAPGSRKGCPCASTWPTSPGARWWSRRPAGRSIAIRRCSSAASSTRKPSLNPIRPRLAQSACVSSSAP